MTDGAPSQILCIVHELDSGPELLGARAVELGFVVDSVVVSPTMPTEIGNYNALVVMGAAPSVNDDHIQIWFQREVALIKDAFAKDIPILGVCFGAQAMAVALGGSVTRSSVPEIGWFEIETSRPELVAAGPWFEWHYDCVTPPPDAAVIASSPVCVQAYTIGRHLAVQFHPEVTVYNVSEWVASETQALVELGLDGPAMIEQTRSSKADAKARADEFFDRFVKHAGLNRPVPAVPS